MSTTPDLACALCGARGEREPEGYMHPFGSQALCRYCLMSQPADVLSAILAAAEGKPPPEPPEPAKLSGKVIGFRAWALDGYRLLSNNRKLGAHWTVGVNEARCLRERYRQGMGLITPPNPEHDAPAPECECGLYAWYSPRHATALRPFGAPPGQQNLGVVGAVSAWGRLEAHRDGFRAQYAQPVALAYDSHSAYEDVKRCEAIASELELPFVPLAELEREAAKHGQPVPEEMRPLDPFSTTAHWGPGGLIPPPSSGGVYRWTGPAGSSPPAAAGVGTYQAQFAPLRPRVSANIFSVHAPRPFSRAVLGIWTVTATVDSAAAIINGSIAPAIAGLIIGLAFLLGLAQRIRWKATHAR